MEKGIIQLYTGDGKGKTTAALGLSFRALGRGFKVKIVQFLKSRDCGELETAKELSPNLEIIRVNSQQKFLFKMNEEERAVVRDEIGRGIEYIKELFREESCDILITDELTWVVNGGFLTMDEVRELARLRPESMEWVITGGRAPAELIELADLVTEMKKIKHPYDEGLPARIGIEK